MSYAQLQSDIASEINRNDMADDIKRWIRYAEVHLSRELNAPEMEVYTELSITDGQVALPDNFNRVLNIEDESGAITFLHRNALDGLGAIDGQPHTYSLQGNILLLYPSPQDGQIIRMRYIGDIPSLSDSEPENWLYSKYPDVYFYTALTYSATRLQEDARLTVWKALSQECIDSINRVSAVKSLGPRLKMQPSTPGYEEMD